MTGGPGEGAGQETLNEFTKKTRTNGQAYMKATQTMRKDQDFVD